MVILSIRHVHKLRRNIWSKDDVRDVMGWMSAGGRDHKQCRSFLVFQEMLIKTDDASTGLQHDRG